MQKGVHVIRKNDTHVRCHDIAYDNEDEGTAPPLWLSDDNIREGIRALTDRDQCLEEQERLLKERSSIQLWFHEEWQVINAAIDQCEYFMIYYLCYLI
ncbi:hypothetical protein FB446DRAFT_634882 [Lentinula raphanica]|nr:hypothetical protein FB446DRAFT_634882 [Lentinula raphanica]